MLLFSLYNTQKNSFAWPKKATRFVGADKIDMHEFCVFQVQHIHYTIPHGSDILTSDKFF